MIHSLILKYKISSQGLGLALGGGGARGFFHIGVLKALEEYNVPISYITGISIGSLIGALFAGGYSSSDIYKILSDHTKSFHEVIEIASLTFHNHTGLFNGGKLITEINHLLGNKKIEELKIPFACRAVNINKFTEIVFDSGNIGIAVKASCAIPGVFTADDQQEEGLVVDGGMMGPVPIQLLKSKFHGPSLAVNLINYDHLTDSQVKELSNSFKKTKTLSAIPFSEPLMRSFYMMQSYITKLEYESYKPDLRVEFSGMIIPSIFKISEFKDKMVDEGYFKTKNILKNLI